MTKTMSRAQLNALPTQCRSPAVPLVVSEHTNMYLIIDSYGTRQSAWRWKDAIEWLAVCSPSALICNRWTGEVLAVREYKK